MKRLLTTTTARSIIWNDPTVSHPTLARKSTHTGTTAAIVRVARLQVGLERVEASTANPPVVLPGQHFRWSHIYRLPIIYIIAY